MEILNTCLLGIGTVFAGLICIIALVEIMHYVLNLQFSNKDGKSEPAATAPAAPTNVSRGVEVRPSEEVVAAITAAIAEELGGNIEGIKIVSIKQI